ncbi:hypothetical protein [Halorussus salinisoli]|uniref:hypothetical protein n=1 Tax=Halorussus salinisoli TaxID=2558242 RepID=UPI0010C207F1|nr:hypothetical protein [Halorussus salinisoli]
MPSSTKSALLTVVRVGLVAVGVGIAATTTLELASMPPPPPDSDGFAHGMAGIVGGVIIVLTLGLAAVGVSLPTLLGRDDRLGFNRWQRLSLKGAGVLIGGGIAVGLAYGLVTELQYGIVLWLGLVALATFVVSATLVWRLAEALLRLLYRTVSRGAS